MQLSKMGYEKVNKLNEKYNITFFEITCMDEFRDFKDSFFTVAENSNIINTKDLQFMHKLCGRLDED